MKPWVADKQPCYLIYIKTNMYIYIYITRKAVSALVTSRCFTCVSLFLLFRQSNADRRFWNVFPIKYCLHIRFITVLCLFDFVRKNKTPLTLCFTWLPPAPPQKNEQQKRPWKHVLACMFSSGVCSVRIIRNNLNLKFIDILFDLK